MALLHKKLEAIETELSTLPPGELRIYSNGKYDKWFYYKDSTGSYLTRKNKDLASKLARKKYLTIKRNAIINDITALEYYQDFYTSSEDELNRFLENENYTQLLTSNFQSEAHYEWMHAEYPRNPYYPEMLTFKCPSGNTVRSKSEVFIDMALTNSQVPYRYECKLMVGNSTFYPDFTILHPFTNELIYWEHFGKMDDFTYANKSSSKLLSYISNGIVPGKNLIMTFETSENPFSYDDAIFALSQFGL